MCNDRQVIKPKSTSKFSTKQLKTISLYLDIATKTIPLCFALFVVLGAIAIWMYLAKYELNSEFSQVISNHQILLQLSLFSLILTGLVCAALFVGPLLYRNACDELSENGSYNKKTLAFDVISLAVTIISQFFILIGIKVPYLNLALSTLLIFITAVIILIFRSKFIDNKEQKTWQTKAYAYAVYASSLFFMFLPLLFLLLLASKTLPSNMYGYIVFFMCVFAYSLSAGLFIFDIKKAVIALVIFILCGFLLAQEKAIYFFIHTYGLSQYHATISIENKACAILDSYSSPPSKKQVNKNKDSSIYEDIWVIADFPSSIIFSANSSSRTYFIIPKASVTGKLISREIPDQQHITTKSR